MVTFKLFLKDDTTLLDDIQLFANQENSDSYLNSNEVIKVLALIENSWHKIFQIIRYHMIRGIQSATNTKKKSLDDD